MYVWITMISQNRLTFQWRYLILISGILCHWEFVNMKVTRTKSEQNYVQTSIFLYIMDRFFLSEHSALKFWAIKPRLISSGHLSLNDWWINNRKGYSHPFNSCPYFFWHFNIMIQTNILYNLITYISLHGYISYLAFNMSTMWWNRASLIFVMVSMCLSMVLFRWFMVSLLVTYTTEIKQTWKS